MPAHASPSPVRLPLVTYVLASGTFLMGTTEFMVAGLLPGVADDLHVTVARAGLLITVFAVGMIVGAPLTTLLTLRLPPRTTLVLALGVFAAGQVIVALGPGFAAVLAARFLTALATSAFWSVAAAVATRSAGSAASARALGIVLGGGVLASVVGVPLGAFAGRLAGWRGPFWALGVLALGAAFLVYRYVPRNGPERQAQSVRSELAGLRSGKLWLALMACATTNGGVLSTYTYIAPLLTGRAGVASKWVPLVLAGFGAGALAGSLLPGRLGDRRPHVTTIAAAAVTTAILAAICLFSAGTALTVVLVALLGMFGAGANPVLISLAIRFAPGAPTLAAALCTSSFNFGTAAGSSIAGFVLASSPHDTGPAVVGTAIATLTLIPVTAIAVTERPAPDVFGSPAGHASEQGESGFGKSRHTRLAPLASAEEAGEFVSQDSLTVTVRGTGDRRDAKGCPAPGQPGAIDFDLEAEAIAREHRGSERDDPARRGLRG